MEISQINNSKIVNHQSRKGACSKSHVGHEPIRGSQLDFTSSIVNRQSSIVNATRGFTLIEIMVVVFIIGILVAIVAPRLISRTDDARVVEAQAQIMNFETALKLFKIDNGFYPTTEQGLEALIQEPVTGRIPKHYRQGGYLEKRKVSLDPWDNLYIYISPGTEGDYDIISYGADGVSGGEGYDKDITNWD
ncbi:MAG TPA: type II secretion system protein GspG [Nitrospirae bacterium]|nr:type II secretion system protein G precursor [bacterium BMS3Abin10]GBE38108.1 type II secretion system protein G precursor [bacterium BMS3Bbin08]HDH49805.1 type II secretion system protein GspG [Nitrospirota bacterium]HDK41386.1 type II secretion system protein GspG [Nitrospirota bacterium]HDZ83691.1 type II secretion system protein GspG [Nitrospirota bacterium]